MIDVSPIDVLMETDAYKLPHGDMYPDDTEIIYSNYTNRRSRMAGVDHVVHFGLQAYIQQHLMDAYEPFFNYPSTGELMRMFTEEVTEILGADAAKSIGADHIGNLHELGYMPLRFCGLPEGTLVPIGVPPFTVENTRPELFGIHPNFSMWTNFVETELSSSYWLPSTTATIAHEYREILDAAAERTGANQADVDFQCHDFSYRGMASPAPSGAAHLLSFKGTDSLKSRAWIRRYYGGPFEAKSVLATEHSIMSAGTASIGEFATYRRLLHKYPTGNLAVVSDTYDLWKVLTEFLPALKDEIMGRRGRLIIRPDSGDPEKILCGDPDADRDSPAYDGVVTLLWKTFGGTTNAKGYRVLDPHIGAIYGDSITLERARSITNHLARMGYVSTTVTLGVGSFSYQYQTRDTFGSAMKAVWALIDGKGVNLFKDPITDDGTKKSATGRLAVRRDSSGLYLLQDVTPENEATSLLQPVWENGKFLQHQTFENVRQTLATQQRYPVGATRSSTPSHASAPAL